MYYTLSHSPIARPEPPSCCCCCPCCCQGCCALLVPVAYSCCPGQVLVPCLHLLSHLPPAPPLLLHSTACAAVLPGMAAGGMAPAASSTSCCRQLQRHVRLQLCCKGASPAANLLLPQPLQRPPSRPPHAINVPPPLHCASWMPQRAMWHLLAPVARQAPCSGAHSAAHEAAASHSHHHHDHLSTSSRSRHSSLKPLPRCPQQSAPR